MATTPPRSGPNPVGPTQRFPGSAEPITRDPKGVDQGHQNSDLDSNRFSQHHTLGPNPNQAAPGHHIHDGALSKQIPATSISELDSGAIDYVPVWSSVSSPQPSLGNGSLKGQYLQLGKLVLISFTLKWGTTTTVGTGASNFSLPVAPATPTNLTYVLHGRFVNGSTVLVAVAHIANGQVDRVNAEGNKIISSTGGITFTTTDQLMVQGWYIAA